MRNPRKSLGHELAPRQIHSLTFLAIGLSVSILAFLPAVREGSGSETIVAERFVLSDSLGHERASLSFNEFGGPSLILYDEQGESRIALEVLFGNVAHFEMNAGGQTRVRLLLFEDGEPHFSIYDDKERIRMTIGIDNGSPSLSVWDTTGLAIRTIE